MILSRNAPGPNGVTVHIDVACDRCGREKHELVPPDGPLRTWAQVLGDWQASDLGANIHLCPDCRVYEILAVALCY